MKWLHRLESADKVYFTPISAQLNSSYKTHIQK
jgi:hypothetical protein